MRKIFLSLLIYFIGVPVFCQNKLVEFSGGMAKLSTILSDEISQSDILTNDKFYLNLPAYYEAQIQINKDGSVGENIIINGISDSSLNETIIRGIKKTNGQWINHSKSDKLIILPFYLHMKTSRLPKDNSVIPKHKLFTDWKESELQYFETIDIGLLGVAH